MRRSTRVGDFCGRYGGEEFVILIAGADLEVTYRVAERHRDSISRISFKALSTQKNVTISVGVSVFDPSNPEDNAQAVLRRADEALYQAKKTGRNRVVRSTEVEASGISPFSRESVIPPAPQTPSRVPSSPEIRMTIEVATPTGEVITAQALPPLEAELVRQLNTGRSGLPVLPTIASEALRLANDPDADVGKFATLVSKDPHFAARFLSLANSAIYSRGLKAASVRDAIVRIGLAGARDLLFQVVYATSTVGLPRFQTQVLKSYQRSVHSGIAARTICRRIQQRYPFDYLSGLLHDIGESRIYRILATVPAAASDPKAVDELVQRYHPKAGAELAAAWQLPADIVDVCEAHHEAGAEARLPVRVVMLSDLIVAVAERPTFSNEPLPEEPRMRELGLKADDITFLVETIRLAMRGTKQEATG
jgi:HD-like signal output (HDOD) protein